MTDSEKIRFDSLDLPPKLQEGIKAAGFEYCTPIQAQTLPRALSGHDVAGQAQTGTGKTAASCWLRCIACWSMPTARTSHGSNRAR